MTRMNLAGARPASADDARQRLLAGIPVTERQLQLSAVRSLRQTGAGPPMVLLHGPGAHGGVWDRVMPELARRPGGRARPSGAGCVHRGGRIVRPACSTGWTRSSRRPATRRPCSSATSSAGRSRPGTPPATPPLASLVLVVPFGLTPFDPAPDVRAGAHRLLEEPSGAPATPSGGTASATSTGSGRHGCAVGGAGVYNLDLARTPAVAAGMRSLMAEFGMPAIPPDVLGRIAMHAADLGERRPPGARWPGGERALRLAADGDRGRRQRAGDRAAGGLLPASAVLAHASPDGPQMTTTTIDSPADGGHVTLTAALNALAPSMTGS